MLGYIRIAEDDSANAAKTVDANECFRHDCDKCVSVESCVVGKIVV